MKSNQDVRCCGGLRRIIPLVSTVFYVSILSTIACPFLAGFYSKDLIIEFLYISEIRMFLILIMLISLSSTVIYSVRLFYYLFFTKSKFYVSRVV